MATIIEQLSMLHIVIDLLHIVLDINYEYIIDIFYDIQDKIFNTYKSVTIGMLQSLTPNFHLFCYRTHPSPHHDASAGT